MIARFARSFATKSPAFYASALANHQQFATIDLKGNVFNEANAKPFFEGADPIKEDQFWRNLRKNNIRINEDYEYISRIDNDYVFINSVDRPVVFHSYVSKSVSILRDDSVQVDRSDPDVKSYHGVLIYGNNVTAPFIPKYLSICLETNRLYFPLMLARVGGMGLLNENVASYFREMITKSEKSERSGYMFRFRTHDYDVEAIQPESIHPHRWFVCFNTCQVCLSVL